METNLPTPMTGRVYVNLLEVIIYFKNTTKNNSCRWYPSTGDLPMFETAPRRISVIQAVDVGDEKSPVRHVGLRVCPNHGGKSVFLFRIGEIIIFFLEMFLR